MNLVPMRFKGVQWHHNPKELSFECGRQINELKAPFGTAYVQDMGRNNMKICGTGELFGGDCMEQFGRLFELFRQGGEGILAIPNIQPVFAVFESLKIVGVPKPNYLTYSFVFREVMEKKSDSAPQKHICENGQTLWDVSYMYGVPIDRLVQLNPWVKRPDEAADGSVVALC